MSESLASLFTVDAAGLALMSVRLLLAVVLGLAIAAVYRRSRPMNDEAESFTVTLVLLTILIAMVTQVIGDNVARAFSLVGALSIVRFRTVVRDTQDTAYVIFAVAIGMAMGANHAAVALGGLVIVGGTAYALRPSTAVVPPADGEYPFVLNVRLVIGTDAEALLGGTIDQYASSRQLISAATARQGMSIEMLYGVAPRTESSAGDMVTALNRLEHVQAVTVRRAAHADA
jgi:uncharacterized membrane protein YhiD involved in acid resistance